MGMGDDTDTESIMNVESNLKAIAISWIEAQKYDVDDNRYHKYSWAVDEVLKFTHDRPDKLWEIILVILNADQSDTTVRSIGAGPLEDLLVYHGKSYIDKVIKSAEKNIILKISAKSTDISDVNDAIRKKFNAGLK
ncbi:MAG: hypothetical protein JKY67_18340 [Pseudomonadales bacterium]|nr:hypothetical protein [Pseudomonadales bacterium]